MTTRGKVFFLLLVTAIVLSALGAWVASGGASPWVAATLVFLVALSAALGARSLVGGLAKSLRTLTDRVERVRPGERSLGISDDREDEATRVASAVERMRGSLLDELAARDDERELLLSVIGGMKEGLLLVGSDRRIRLANDAFRQIFASPFDPAGHMLAEVVRNPTVIRELHSALAEVREVRELVLHASDSGRSFELHVTPLGGRAPHGSGGALVLFFDITRLEALEEVRREFVANVSHELRTPLTAIKAFVETMAEEGLEDRESSLGFLEIVRKHTDRMGELIDDLTDLSQIETGAVSLDLEDVDVHLVANEIAAQLAHRHAASGVDVEVDVPSPFLLRSDRRRLEQILINLVDNGIKFNRRGGSVRVTGAVTRGRPTVVVSDTGIGIPADSIEKVFHRFYRVDKARSRDVGGTGLGLAIVKHLMRLHGGQVTLESELGRGSRFVLEFPPRG